MIVEFDARVLAPFEIAARIDALLTEPGVSPKRHAALVRRLCNDQIAVELEARPWRRAELQARYPQYDPARDPTDNHIHTSEHPGIRDMQEQYRIELDGQELDATIGLEPGAIIFKSRRGTVRYAWSANGPPAGVATRNSATPAVRGRVHGPWRAA